MARVPRTETGDPTAEQPNAPGESPKDSPAPVANTVTIAGRTFNYSPRYSAGHSVNAAEAEVLNQHLLKNARNAFSKRIEEMQASGGFDQTAAQEQFNSYLSGYAFDTSRGGGRTVDEVEKMALLIAINSVKKAIRQKGGKVSDYSAKDITEQARLALQRYPKIRELARKRVEEEKALSFESDQPEEALA